MLKRSRKLRILPAARLPALARALTAVLCLAALSSAVVPALGSARPAEGTTEPYSLTLKGSDGPNVIDIAYDGTQYVITANGTLKPARTCVNPGGILTELDCPAADISGLQVIARGGNDTVTVGKSVPIATILSGGPGLDDLIGGANTDKLQGGDGDDRLVGRMGPDQLYGGPGEDDIFGGAGKDVLRGGPGIDILHGGPGRDDELP